MVQLRGSIEGIKERVSEATERESGDFDESDGQIIARLRGERNSEESEVNLE